MYATAFDEFGSISKGYPRAHMRFGDRRCGRSASASSSVEILCGVDGVGGADGGRRRSRGLRRRAAALAESTDATVS